MTLPIFQRTITNESGNVLDAASVDVFKETDGTRAALFSDRAGNNSITNPATADDEGFVQFYVAAGDYKIVATKGSETKTWRHEGIWSLDSYSDAITKDVAGGVDVTLTDAESSGEIIEFTGALTANINVIVPTKSRQWLILNNTSGSFTLTVKTSAGAGVAVPQGLEYELRCDGTDVIFVGGPATNAQALAGTDLLRYMSSRRVHEAFNQFGLGAPSPNNTNSANDYPLGSIVQNASDEQTAVANDLPALGGSGTTPRYWITETYGVSNRTTQKSTEVFGNGTVRNRTFVRVKHDATWYPWQEVYHTGNATGTIIKRDFVSTGSLLSTTNSIPYDDTIPQITEGAEALSIAFTPRRSDTRIRIRSVLQLRTATLNEIHTVALFDGSSDALAVAANFADDGNTSTPICADVASTGSTTTFSVRFGAQDADTIYLNGNDLGNRRYGGAFASTLEIEEYTV